MTLKMFNSMTGISIPWFKLITYVPYVLFLPYCQNNIYIFFWFIFISNYWLKAERVQPLRKKTTTNDGILFPHKLYVNWSMHDRLTHDTRWRKLTYSIIQTSTNMFRNTVEIDRLNHNKKKHLLTDDSVAVNVGQSLLSLIAQTSLAPRALLGTTLYTHPLQ